MNKGIEDVYKNEPVTKIYFNDKYNSLYDNNENYNKLSFSYYTLIVHYNTFFYNCTIFI